MRILLFGLLTILASSSIHAQSNNYNLLKRQSILEYSMFQAQPDVMKKPGRAVLISVGATITTFFISPVLLSNDVLYTASLLTVLALFSLAPGAGYLYINNTDQFIKGGIQRGLSILAFSTGGLIVLVSAFDELFENDDDPNSLAYVLGFGLMLSGFAFYVYTSFRDFIGVHRDTKLYNEERTLSLRLIPVVDPIHSVYGAGLQLRF